MQIEMRPLSDLLKSIGKTDCLFCAEPATQEAYAAGERVTAEIRCCDKAPCIETARNFAEMWVELTAEEKAEKVVALCKKFIVDNDITGPGMALWKSKKINDNVPDFIYEICEIIGYRKEKKCS